jgi:hypothetical protein
MKIEGKLTLARKVVETMIAKGMEVGNLLVDLPL